MAEAKFLDRDVRAVIEEQFDRGNDMSVMMEDLALLKRRYVSENHASVQFRLFAVCVFAAGSLENNSRYRQGFAVW